MIKFPSKGSIFEYFVDTVSYSLAVLGRELKLLPAPGYSGKCILKSFAFRLQCCFGGHS